MRGMWTPTATSGPAPLATRCPASASTRSISSPYVSRAGGCLHRDRRRAGTRPASRRDRGGPTARARARPTTARPAGRARRRREGRWRRPACRDRRRGRWPCGGRRARRWPRRRGRSGIDPAGEVIAPVGDVDGEVELGRAGVDVHVLAERSCRGQVPQLEQDLDERRVVEGAGHVLDEQLEGHGLMRVANRHTSRVRATTSASVGSPSRRTRTGTVLRNGPITPSARGSRRFATGTPTTTSSRPVWR